MKKMVSFLLLLMFFIPWNVDAYDDLLFDLMMLAESDGIELFHHGTTLGQSSGVLMGTLGSFALLRGIALLPALNTGMHAYVINRLHVMNNKIGQVGQSVRDLINDVAEHRAQSVQAHERTQTDLALHRAESIRAHQYTHETVQQTNEELCKQIEQLRGEVRQMDSRQARRVRRVARVLAQQNSRQFAQLLENQEQMLANQQRSMIMRVAEYVQNGVKNNPEVVRAMVKMLRRAG